MDGHYYQSAIKYPRFALYACVSSCLLTYSIHVTHSKLDDTDKHVTFVRVAILHFYHLVIANSVLHASSARAKKQQELQYSVRHRIVQVTEAFECDHAWAIELLHAANQPYAPRAVHL